MHWLSKKIDPKWLQSIWEHTDPLNAAMDIIFDKISNMHILPMCFWHFCILSLCFLQYSKGASYYHMPLSSQSISAKFSHLGRYKSAHNQRRLCRHSDAVSINCLRTERHFCWLWFSNCEEGSVELIRFLSDIWREYLEFPLFLRCNETVQISYSEI